MMQYKAADFKWHSALMNYALNMEPEILLFYIFSAVNVFIFNLK